MATTKITLNELRSIVKQIIKEENERLDVPIVQKYGKEIGKFYTASLPAELKGGDVSDTNVRVDSKVKLLGMQNYGQDNGLLAVEIQNDTFFVDPINKQRYGYKKGERHIVQPKYLK